MKSNNAKREEVTHLLKELQEKAARARQGISTNASGLNSSCFANTFTSSVDGLSFVGQSNLVDKKFPYVNIPSSLGKNDYEAAQWESVSKKPSFVKTFSRLPGAKSGSCDDVDFFADNAESYSSALKRMSHTGGKSVNEQSGLEQVKPSTKISFTDVNEDRLKASTPIKHSTPTKMDKLLTSFDKSFSPLKMENLHEAKPKMCKMSPKRVDDLMSFFATDFVQQFPKKMEEKAQCTVQVDNPANGSDDLGLLIEMLPSPKAAEHIFANEQRVGEVALLDTVVNNGQFAQSSKCTVGKEAVHLLDTVENLQNFKMPLLDLSSTNTSEKYVANARGPSNTASQTDDVKSFDFSTETYATCEQPMKSSESGADLKLVDAGIDCAAWKGDAFVIDSGEPREKPSAPIMPEGGSAYEFNVGKCDVHLAQAMNDTENTTGDFEKTNSIAKELRKEANAHSLKGVESVRSESHSNEFWNFCERDPLQHPVVTDSDRTVDSAHLTFLSASSDRSSDSAEVDSDLFNTYGDFVNSFTKKLKLSSSEDDDSGDSTKSSSVCAHSFDSLVRHSYQVSEVDSNISAELKAMVQPENPYFSTLAKDQKTTKGKLKNYLRSAYKICRNTTNALIITVKLLCYIFFYLFVIGKFCLLTIRTLYVGSRKAIKAFQSTLELVKHPKRLIKSHMSEEKEEGKKVEGSEVGADNFSEVVASQVVSVTEPLSASSELHSSKDEERNLMESLDQFISFENRLSEVLDESTVERSPRRIYNFDPSVTRTSNVPSDIWSAYEANIQKINARISRAKSEWKGEQSPARIYSFDSSVTRSNTVRSEKRKSLLSAYKANFQEVDAIISCAKSDWNREQSPPPIYSLGSSVARRDTLHSEQLKNLLSACNADFQKFDARSSRANSSLPKLDHRLLELSGKTTPSSQNTSEAKYLTMSKDFSLFNNMASTSGVKQEDDGQPFSPSQERQDSSLFTSYQATGVNISSSIFDVLKADMSASQSFLSTNEEEDIQMIVHEKPGLMNSTRIHPLAAANDSESSTTTDESLNSSEELADHCNGNALTGSACNEVGDLIKLSEDSPLVVDAEEEKTKLSFFNDGTLNVDNKNISTCSKGKNEQDSRRSPESIFCHLNLHGSRMRQENAKGADSRCGEQFSALSMASEDFQELTNVSLSKLNKSDSTSFVVNEPPIYSSGQCLIPEKMSTVDDYVEVKGNQSAICPISLACVGEDRLDSVKQCEVADVGKAVDLADEGPLSLELVNSDYAKSFTQSVTVDDTFDRSTSVLSDRVAIECSLDSRQLDSVNSFQEGRQSIFFLNLSNIERCKTVKKSTQPPGSDCASARKVLDFAKLATETDSSMLKGVVKKDEVNSISIDQTYVNLSGSLSRKGVKPIGLRNSAFSKKFSRSSRKEVLPCKHSPLPTFISNGFNDSRSDDSVVNSLCRKRGDASKVLVLSNSDGHHKTARKSKIWAKQFSDGRMSKSFAVERSSLTMDFKTARYRNTNLQNKSMNGPSYRETRASVLRKAATDSKQRL